jgi:hypothetical protein
MSLFAHPSLFSPAPRRIGFNANGRPPSGLAREALNHNHHPGSHYLTPGLKPLTFPADFFRLAARNR